MSKRQPFPVEALIVVSVFVVMWLLWMCAPADAATFPYYNLEGYRSILRVSNPTDTAVAWTPYGRCSVSPCFSTKIEAYQSTPFLDVFPPKSGGVQNVDIPSPLVGTVEVVSNDGWHVRVPALSTYKKAAQVQDFSVDPSEQTFLFVACTGSCQVVWYRDRFEVGRFNLADEVRISPAPFATNRAVVLATQFGAPFFESSFEVFGFNRRTAPPYAFQSILNATEIK